MRRFPVLLLLLVLSSGQAAETAGLPAEAQKVIDKAEAAVAAANKTAAELIAKARAQELKELQRLLDATKKTDQARLQALREVIEEVKSTVVPPILIADGKALAFLGDSITQQGWENANGYVKEVVSGLEANGIKVTPIPAGISGHKSNDMLGRLERDVLSKKPDWMTLSCGVNDVWHGANGVPLDKYKENIISILDQAKTAGVKVMLLTATMIKEDASNAENQKLAEYNDFLRSIAKDRGLPLADLNADMQAAIKEAGKPGGNLLTVDGVHMNPAGNQMMARGILRAFGLDKSAIAKAEAAWATGKP